MGARAARPGRRRRRHPEPALPRLPDAARLHRRDVDGHLRGLSPGQRSRGVPAGPPGRPAVPAAGHALWHRHRRSRIGRPGPRDEHRLADRRSCRLRHRARRHHRRRGRGRHQRRGQGARRPGVGDGVHPRHGPGPRPRGRAHRVRPGSRRPALRREPGAARRRVRRARQRAWARGLDRRRGARRGPRRRPRHDPHRPAGPRRRGRERFPRLGRGRALPRADLLGRRPLPRA